MKLKDIRPGKKVFYVHAFPSRPRDSYINEMVVNSKPYKTKHGSTFMDVTKAYEDEEGRRYLYYDTHASLTDCNVIPNRYNFHRLFFTLKAAIRYMIRINMNEFTPEEAEKYARYLENEQMNKHNLGWDD